MAAKRKEKEKRRISWRWTGKRWWCSGAEETNRSKSKLVWKKNSAQTFVERFQLFILMWCMIQRWKKVLAISDCTNVCFIAEDLLYCVWKGMLHVNFPAISSLLHIRQILALSWKIWPPKMACRSHFGPQAEFSGWNTGVGHYLTAM